MATQKSQGTDPMMRPTSGLPQNKQVKEPSQLAEHDISNVDHEPGNDDEESSQFYKSMQSDRQKQSVPQQQAAHTQTTGTNNRPNVDPPQSKSVGIGPSPEDEVVPNESARLTEEFQRYMDSLSDTDQRQYNNLLEQNIRMRGDLMEIATQIDVLSGKQRADKAEQLLDKLDFSPETTELLAELEEKNAYINSLNAKLTEKRKNVASFTRANEVQDKENTIMYLRKKVDEARREVTSLRKVVEAQQADISALSLDNNQQDRLESLEEEIKLQKQELKRARDRNMEEEKQSKSVLEELAQIRKKKNKIRECIAILKHSQPLPRKREPGRRIIVMQSDLDALYAEIQELEARRDELLEQVEGEKLRYSELLKLARQENKELRIQLEAKDRVDCMLKLRS